MPRGIKLHPSERTETKPFIRSPVEINSKMSGHAALAARDNLVHRHTDDVVENEPKD